jgi:hypothetical protein
MSTETKARPKPQRKVNPLPARARKETPSPMNTLTDVEDENPDNLISGLGRSLSIIHLDNDPVRKKFIYLLEVSA